MRKIITQQMFFPKNKNKFKESEASKNILLLRTATLKQILTLFLYVMSEKAKQRIDTVTENTIH